MKRILILVLLAAGFTASAQSGSLKITNNNPACWVFVTMKAIDPAYGNPSVCDIIVGQINVPPAGGTASFPTPDLLDISMGGPGINAITTPMTVADLALSTTFTYTDASFQHYCPLPCTGYTTGGNMCDPMMLGSTCIPGLFPSYSGTGCIVGGTWANPSSALFHGNVQLVFN